MSQLELAANSSFHVIMYSSSLGLQILTAANAPNRDEGLTTDVIEAEALAYRSRDGIDIYSNGWGPSDSGSRVDGPMNLTKLVLKNGARKV